MDIKQIVFPKAQYDDLMAHCHRKFNEKYLPEEKHERKAYGLIGGKRDAEKMVVAKVFALRKNVRKDEQYDDEMTKAMYNHAIPSKTPFEPQMTSSEAAESVTIVIKTSESRATALGESAQAAPSDNSCCALLSVRFQTVKGCPAFKR